MENMDLQGETLIATSSVVSVSRKKSSTRVIVISDLHLGGEPAMMNRPDWLEAFIDRPPIDLAHDEVLELVIAGDFIDFLAIQPYAEFTPNPIVAVQKLRTVIDSPSKFAGIFDALGRHISRGHRLAILVGNHDVEMALPAVQHTLLERVGATPYTLRFIDDGRAYRIGGALIEHGNAYDGANANDWTGLRHLASSQSRAWPPERDFLASPGSKIVNTVVNELKDRYPFVQLLQPEGELLALLLLAFEPKLGRDFKKIGSLLRGQQLASAPPKRGVRPISAGVTSPLTLDPELLEAFGGDYKTLVLQPNGDISATSEWFRSWIIADKDSLSEILKKGDLIPENRLKQIRLAMAKMLFDDDSDKPDGSAEQYGEEAKRMLSSINGLEVVVMGHTHLPRCKRYTHGTYINSGTWIDRFRIPSLVTTDATGAALHNFLIQLLIGKGITLLPPTYADLSIASTGKVTRAELRSFEGPTR